ncbi:MAG: hypothetical protein KKH51_13010 [Actinobacteria bacterium]|nr:hypothetical protein [Actinomycetota bacterium]
MRPSGGVALVAAAVGSMILTGCMQSGPTVVTFEVADQGTYKIELITDEQIQHVKDLMAGSEEGRIPVGTIVRDDPGVNAPWSWHIDPATLEFADQTIEVCDGLPEYVEDGTLTSNTYCPWSAVPIKLEGPGA